MTKRKVREDFNPAREYSVDVEGCSESMKKEVQQAFFDVGIVWTPARRTNAYEHLNAAQYSNAHSKDDVSTYLMYSSTTEDCNMTAEEFINLVYEPGHIHAELMALYAEDAKTHTEPWKLWQIKTAAHNWIDCQFSPGWDPSCEFRRKPKTHFVHGVEIPDLRVSPGYNGYYYLADHTESEFTYLYLFCGDSQDNLWIERGLAYQHSEEGKQAAILHAKAMLGII